MRKQHKRYRIKSKFRFITFLVIVIGLTVGLFGYITGFDISTALVRHTNDVHIEILAGDTIWDIADKYKNDNTDLRKAVYEICQANDIHDGAIQEGMTLIIPESL